MLFTFLTVVQAIVAAALVGTILIQRSEGGGLGVGGSPSGMMSARGAADFLTRATAILATLFVALSIALAVVAVGAHTSDTIDTSLQRTAPSAAPAEPTMDPAALDPLNAAPGSATPAVPAGEAPATADPLDAAADK